MSKKSALFIFSALLATPSLAADKGTDWITKPFWNLKTSTYRATYKIENILPENGDCSSPANPLAVGGKSIFKEIGSKDRDKIISFDYIKDPGTGTMPDLDTPYKLCVEKVESYKYSRAGGIDTGILVIPYKVRAGDLYSDSTLGPYVALKGANFSLLGTFGMTQVSVADKSTADIKTETGLSGAIGLVWSIDNSFDIGLVSGIDHLSGSAGDDFKYQDKLWWSFGIGYKFTKD